MIASRLKGTVMEAASRAGTVKHSDSPGCASSYHGGNALFRKCHNEVPNVANRVTRKVTSENACCDITCVHETDRCPSPELGEGFSHIYFDVDRRPVAVATIEDPVEEEEKAVYDTKPPPGYKKLKRLPGDTIADTPSAQKRRRRSRTLTPIWCDGFSGDEVKPSKAKTEGTKKRKRSDPSPIMSGTLDVVLLGQAPAPTFKKEILEPLRPAPAQKRRQPSGFGGINIDILWADEYEPLAMGNDDDNVANNNKKESETVPAASKGNHSRIDDEWYFMGILPPLRQPEPKAGKSCAWKSKATIIPSV